MKVTQDYLHARQDVKGNVNAIFNPRVLTNPRDMCYLTYEIQAGVVNIVRQSDEVMLRI